MLFVERVRTYTANGETNPVTKAVTECIREGIFADYLRERGSEVENMLIAEYDYETDIAVHELEAEERGIQIGEKRGIQIGEERGMLIGEKRGRIAQIRKKLQKQKSLEQIADEIEEGVEYVSEIAALIQQHPESTDMEIYQSYISETTK
jgi:predicted transposase YdaD